MSKLLKQLLKNSLVPASLMIVSKLAGIFIVTNIFDLPITIGNDISGIFSVQLYLDNREDTILVNTFSNGVMFLTLTLGYLILVSRYFLYHKSLYDPKTIVKLTKFNLTKWITDKSNGFPKVFVWGSFSLASSSVVISSSLSGGTYGFVGIIAMLTAIFTIWSLLRTFEIETAKIYPRNSNNYY